MSNIKDNINRNHEFNEMLYPEFPKNMLVELTNACNHQCLFCANRKMTRKVGHINKDFFFRILKEAYELGTRQVGFYATGEPFLSSNLSLFVNEAKKIGYEYVYVTTNGALANPERVKEVLQSGLDSIKFSINAGTQETYKMIHGRDDFNTVLKNLKFLSDYRKEKSLNFKIYISYVRTKQNKDECDLLKNQVNSYIDDIVFYDVYNQGGNMYEINNYMTIDENYRPMKAPCYMLFNRLNITYEGYLNICCVDFQNYLAIADLNKVSLLDSWHSKEFVEIRHKHLNNAIEGTSCYNCVNNECTNISPLVQELAVIADEDIERGESEVRERLNILR